jgi:2-dehydro-3-deoxygalactonokinase
MSSYAVVDSGTTTTRLRLWRDGAVRWTGTVAAGARDTAITGEPSAIRAAVAELLARARRESGLRPEAIVCSGMITSNLGLHDVPHLTAPAGPAELAAGIERVTIPDLGELWFIPGVKTLPGPLTLATLAEGDVLRGEEAEIAGLRDALGLQGAATFLHFGSHHKAIDVDAEGRILASRTAITGELLAAVAGHTILASSVAIRTDLDLDLEAVRAGAEATQTHDLGRALFLVRVGELLGGLARERLTSYLIGALAALDLSLLPAEDGVEIVLYGGGAFPEALEVLLADQGRQRVLRVDRETSDLAAVRGAVALFERARRERRERGEPGEPGERREGRTT